MKKLLLIVLFPYYIILTAQEDFRPGYIINNKYDTIKGLIDYNSNKYYQINFKLTNSNNIIKYKPFEISSYRFNDDKFYVSMIVSIQKTYIKKEQITYNINEPLAPRYIEKAWYDINGNKNDTVFLEYLIDGKDKIFY